MKKRILFVYEHKKPDYWMDGLSMALYKLADTFQIDRCNLATDDCETETEEYDFILGWGAFGSPADAHIQARVDSGDTTPTGLCLGGNVTPVPSNYIYNLVFYETDWVKENYLKGINRKTELIKAFGINNDLFDKIDINVPVVWDYIGVGAFANWKRWERMADKRGMRLVVGEYQKRNETESISIIKDLVRGGVMVSPMVHPLDLANFYHWSRTAYIPADIYGGGERTVLEARNCGLSIEIEPDNPKLQELLDCPIPTYEDYANSLKKGILSCLR